MAYKPSIAIIGAGRAGTALGAALAAVGYSVTAVASRRLETAEALAARLSCLAVAQPEDAARRAEVVWITTPDRAIGTVAGVIAAAGGFSPGQHVFHASGALSADILAPARKKGAHAASIHPLQSLTSETRPSDLRGCSFALEGDEEALPLARRMVSDLGGEVLPLRAQDKMLYHAAASITSNYLVVLLELAVRLLEKCGVQRGNGTSALIPLAEGTLANIERLGVRDALTGPLARGDVVTVRGHTDALRSIDDREAADLYARLGRCAVGLARTRGDISPEVAVILEQELRSLLKGADSDGEW